MIPIDNKVKGLLRFSIEQKIKLLELKVELHRLMFDLNDVKLVNTIMKGLIERIDQNPLNNDSIFSSINSKIIKQFNYNYYQLEDLSNKFKFINEYDDLNEEIDFPGDIFKCKMRLFVRDIKRMQRFINSFLFNYPIILDTLRFVEKRTSGLVLPAAESEGLFNEPVKTAVEKEEETLVENNERTLIDEILEFLIISTPLLSYLIHLILNYYRFFNISKINKTDNKLTISLNGIVPNELYINKAYLLGLISSLEKVSLDIVNLHTKNLVKFIYNYSEKLSNIELCCCNYILLFFCIRHLLETHKNWLNNNLEEVFCNSNSQIKLLNKYIPKISGLPIEYQYCEKEEKLTDVQKISEQYKYMKSIDQEKFAEFVFNDLDQPPNSAAGINIGLRNVLDLDTLFQNKEQTSEFIDQQQKNLISLLSYQKNEDKVITNAFSLFLKYIENPVVLVTEKDKVHQLPNNVVNCFEKLKSLLNDNNFKKENINTQYYYEKLMKILPEDFQFSNTLYIIYQIIIPYMYYFYDVKMFEDVFLTTYKI